MAANGGTSQISLSDCSNELSWLDKKLFLNSISPSAKNRIVKRNEVYYCYFGVGIGSEMSKKRPCVILQVNSYNTTSGNTIVAPITHDTANLSCMIPVDERKDQNGNIILNGQINISNLMCVSKARLGDKICTLNSKEIKNLNSALYSHLAIDEYIKELERRIKSKDKYIDELKEARKKDRQFFNDLGTVFGVKNRERILKKAKDLLTKCE